MTNHFWQQETQTTEYTIRTHSSQHESPILQSHRFALRCIAAAHTSESQLHTPCSQPTEATKVHRQQLFCGNKFVTSSAAAHAR